MLFIWFFLNGKTFCASLTHGLMAVIFWVMMYLYHENQDNIARLSLINSIVYFIVDLTIRFDYNKTAHHILCMFGFTLTLFHSTEAMLFTAKLCGLIELTNPFWTFLRLRVEKSNEIRLPIWYTKIVAGIIYIILFFCIRIVWLSIILYNDFPANISIEICYMTFIPFYILNLWLFIQLIYKSIQALKKM